MRQAIACSLSALVLLPSAASAKQFATYVVNGTAEAIIEVMICDESDDGCVNVIDRPIPSQSLRRVVIDGWSDTCEFTGFVRGESGNGTEVIGYATCFPEDEGVIIINPEDFDPNREMQ